MKVRYVDDMPYCMLIENLDTWKTSPIIEIDDDLIAEWNKAWESINKIEDIAIKTLRETSYRY